MPCGAFEHELHVLHCCDVGSALEFDRCHIVFEPCLRFFFCVVLVPLLIFPVVIYSSSHASGSSSPLYFNVVELSLNPFGMRVSRTARAKHSAPHGSISSSEASASEYSSRAVRRRLLRL